MAEIAESKPYLYVLMRDDLRSLGAGKAIAQGCHAANQFMASINRMDQEIVIDEMADALRKARGDIFDRRGSITEVEEFNGWWIIQTIDKALALRGHDVPPLNEEKGDAMRAMVAMARAWEQSTPDGFGVTICLGVNAEELRTAVMVAQVFGHVAGVTRDPTYPLVDSMPGEPPVLHTFPLDTCGYVFGDQDALRPILKNFPLFPVQMPPHFMRKKKKKKGKAKRR